MAVTARGLSRQVSTEVDEQRLGVGPEQRIDIEIQVPVDQVLVLEHDGALHVEAALQLVPEPRP